MLVDIKLVEKYLIPSLIHGTYLQFRGQNSNIRIRDGILYEKKQKKNLGNNDFRKSHSTLTISPHWLI